MKISEFCRELGVTRQTVLRWEKLGYITPKRVAISPKYSQRIFTKEDVDKIKRYLMLTHWEKVIESIKVKMKGDSNNV